MLPKLNQNENSKNTSTGDVNPMNTSLVSLKNKFMVLPSFLNGTINNTNKSSSKQINIFSHQNNDPQVNSQNKWILSKIDNNTNRIISAYKKQNSNFISHSECNSPELQKKSMQQAQQNENQTKRRRRIIKICDADLSNQQSTQNDSNNTQETQTTEPSQIPTITQSSSNKKRKLVRSMLYVQPNTSDQFIIQQNENLMQANQVQSPQPLSASDYILRNKQQINFSEASTIIRDKAETLSLNKQSSQSINLTDKSQTSLSSIKSLSHQRTQSSIQFIGSTENEKECSPKSDNQTSQINLVQNDQGMKCQLSHPNFKSILKCSSQKQTASPYIRISKKQVSFSQIKQVF
ncbi:hypothetical protein TTHERM_01013130 (macronuclear) [Tetrahymena thermophila SB210]|uniref:Uncharacterized protein n=1 Tax=Tetrahymena thermophila (strain SB210) TaxID=312017 RepID=Q22L40_TETTS|nr:hypothetical protein TTHERM_01013130 [Tetrahymena thermophila SB210]EAR85977.1 hypothetical protein TTHERM_01013130 [Tetrahymena thermophila SB210]|eukprot:XP_976572.1 hypothetical protein TTHERM_01013130 [Tetrahymena thermophila SB210]